MSSSNRILISETTTVVRLTLLHLHRLLCLLCLLIMIVTSLASRHCHGHGLVLFMQSLQVLELRTVDKPNQTRVHRKQSELVGRAKLGWLLRCCCRRCLRGQRCSSTCHGFSLGLRGPVAFAVFGLDVPYPLQDLPGREDASSLDVFLRLRLGHGRTSCARPCLPFFL